VIELLIAILKWGSLLGMARGAYLCASRWLGIQEKWIHKQVDVEKLEPRPPLPTDLLIRAAEESEPWAREQTKEAIYAQGREFNYDWDKVREVLEKTSERVN
jgi:hypothetical protein